MAAGEQLDIDRAVASARAAFRTGSWSQQPPKARKKVLLKFAELILGEPGRARAARDARHGQAHLRQPERRHSRRRELHPLVRAKRSTRSTTKWRRPGRNALAMITREPMGVVGAIVPWNFPLLMAAWKIGPVLASGQFAGAQAVGEIAADRAARGGARAWRRAFPKACSTWCPASATPRARRWRCTWTSTASRSPAPPPPASSVMQYAGAVEPQEGVARVRRQVAEHRARRLPGSRQGRDGRGLRHLLQPGRDVLGGLAPAGAGVASRTRCSRRSQAVGRSMKPGDPLDPATKLGAIVDETQMKRVLALHRRRQERRRDGGARRQTRARGQRRILRRAHGVRRRVARA